MTRSVEIPDEAVAKAAWVFAEHRSRAWLTYSDETRARLAESWQPTTRAALEAALPYLAPAPPFDVIIDAIAARATAPVDRQALVRAIADELDSEGIVSYGLTPKLVDAVVALLAGEQEQVESPE